MITNEARPNNCAICGGLIYKAEDYYGKYIACMCCGRSQELGVEPYPLPPVAQTRNDLKDHVLGLKVLQAHWESQKPENGGKKGSVRRTANAMNMSDSQVAELLYRTRNWLKEDRAEQCECVQCGRVWKPQRSEAPERCPSCNSTNWDGTPVVRDQASGIKRRVQ